MMQRSVLLLIRPARTCMRPRVGHRSFHESVRTCSASQDNRGRRRFYKNVGIIPTGPPWEDADNPLKSSTVDSPISAGVDDTQSASGVSVSLTDASSLQRMLQPRHAISNTPMDNTWFGVTLDNKSLKTPLGQPLAVPSLFLACAIAAEWDAQKTTIHPAQMPLMTLSCTTLDQVATSPEFYKEQVLRFLSTDTTCYWADPIEDRVLYKNQQQSWESLHDYCKYFLGSSPAVAMGTAEHLVMSRARSQKESGLPHDERLLQAAREWVDTLDAWHLCALYSVSSEAKSFLVGMAVVNSAEGPFDTISKAVAASRVEEEFQISNWGLVEGGHDYDRLNCSIQIHAAHVLISSIASAE